MIAGFILCQQYLVKTLVFLLFAEYLFMTVFYHVKLTTYYWLDYRLKNILSISIFSHYFGILPCLVYKVKHAKHIAMVSNSQCRHVVLLCLFIQLADAGSTIQQRILCMYV